MHEWRLCRALCREIEQAARAQGAVRVISARVRLGASLGISAERLREQFAIAAAQGPAASAALEIEITADPDHALELLVESIDVGGE